MRQLWSLGVRAAVLQSIVTAAGRMYNSEICRTKKSWKKAISPIAPYRHSRRSIALGDKRYITHMLCVWRTGALRSKAFLVWMVSCLLFSWFLLASGVEAGWAKGCGKHYRSHLMGDLEDLLFCWWEVLIWFSFPNVYCWVPQNQGGVIKLP